MAPESTEIAKRDRIVNSDKESLRRVRSSMVNIRVGGRTYPAQRNPRCKICTHPARPLIEERLLYNDTYVAIAAWVTGQEAEQLNGIRITWPEINVAQLSAHYRNGHCPVDTQVLHALTERRATELGVSYEETGGRIVDHMVMLQQIATRGQERLIRGEIEPGIKETISAAKALAAIQLAGQMQEESVDLSAYEQSMGIYFDETRKIMNDEQWDQLVFALSTNPILRKLAERLQSDDVVEAEVVADDQ